MTDQELTGHVIELYGLVRELAERLDKAESVLTTIREGREQQDTLRAVAAAYPLPPGSVIEYVGPSRERSIRFGRRRGR